VVARVMAGQLDWRMIVYFPTYDSMI